MQEGQLKLAVPPLERHFAIEEKGVMQVFGLIKWGRKSPEHS